MNENPKEAEGRKKCPMHLLPPTSLRQTANVLGHGADRYGPWNWRDTEISAHTYVGAILRHLTAWWEGQQTDPDSGEDHMAHIAASAMIVMDAAAHGKLKYDVPKFRNTESVSSPITNNIRVKVVARFSMFHEMIGTVLEKDPDSSGWIVNIPHFGPIHFGEHEIEPV